MNKITKVFVGIAAILAFFTLILLTFSDYFRREVINIEETANRPSWVGQYLAGYHAARNRDYEKASEFFANSLDSQKTSEFLQSRTLTLLLVSGKFEDAYKVAETLDKNDDSGLAGLTIIASKIDKGAYEEADKILTEISKNKQDTVVHKLVHAWVKLGAGKPLAAQAIMQSVENEKGLEQLFGYHYALIAELSGNNALAEQLYGKLVSRPSVPASITAAAYSFYGKIGNKQKQQALLSKNADKEKILGYHPVSTVKEGVAEAFLSVAGLVMVEYSPDKAAAFFRLALKLNNNLDEAKMLLGSILISEGDYKAANTILRGINNKSYLSDYARLAIARNFEALQDDSRAKEYFEDLLASDETRVEALISLGDLKRKDENFDDSINYYSRAIDEVKKTSKGKVESKYWAIFFARGACYERLLDYTKAEQDLRDALKLNPDQPDVLNYLGYTMLELNKNLLEAAELIEKAFRQRPNDAHIIDSKGWAHFKLGEYEDAVAYLEDAASLMPYDPTVNDHLGDVYWHVGRENEARFQWQRALDNEPEKRFIAAIKDKLENGVTSKVAENARR